MSTSFAAAAAAVSTAAFWGEGGVCVGGVGARPVVAALAGSRRRVGAALAVG